MKKIINGKIYNTETATCIADENKSLFNFYSTSESLYRTKSGNWFIYGESSAGGRYGRSSEGGRTESSGEDIVAIKPEEAARWAETAHITSDEQAAIATALNLVEA
jgi:hypothetical protein